MALAKWIRCKCSEGGKQCREPALYISIDHADVETPKCGPHAERDTRVRNIEPGDYEKWGQI